jgi:hypothetical protein
MELAKNLTRGNGLDEVSLTLTTISERSTLMGQWVQFGNLFSSDHRSGELSGTSQGESTAAPILSTSLTLFKDRLVFFRKRWTSQIMEGVGG